jgi:hypothetical protein
MVAGMSASIRPSVPAPQASLVHRKSLIGFRDACEQIWGAAGLAKICEALPSDVQERTGGSRPLEPWHDLGDLIAWHRAVWEGPARRDEKLMTQHIHATVDRGFGRVKRFLLSVSTPRSLAPRVAALWRDEYSTGRLEATFPEDHAVQLALRDHPYVDDPLMRYVIAEVFRYVLSMTRVNKVTVSYGMLDAALVVTLRWE